jgi:hypothetical protein
LPSGAATETTLSAIDTELTDGSQKAIVRGGAKGATVAADCTSVTVDADQQALLVTEAYLRGYEDETNGIAGVQIKPLAVSTYAWSTDVSAALEASSISKASAGVLRSASWRLDSTAPNGTYYLQVLNAASLPGDGAVTHLVAPIKVIHATGTDDYITLDATDNGVYASTGIVTCLSSSEFTKTISGAYLSGTVEYK